MAKIVREQPSGSPREGASPAPGRRRSVVTMVALGIALLLVCDGIFGQRGVLANRRAQARYEAAVRALEEARQRNAALREEARRLKQDPAAIEEAARRDLGLMKPGEKLFILKDLPKADKK